MVGGSRGCGVSCSDCTTHRPGVAGRPRLIAIDGRGGAGKSTLVERLRLIVPASEVVHTDDIAWNHAFFDWGGVMAANILRPLHRGGGPPPNPTIR